MKDVNCHFDHILDIYTVVVCSSKDAKSDNGAKHAQKEEGRLQGETCWKCLQNESEIKNMKQEISNINNLINKLIENQQGSISHSDEKTRKIEVEDVLTIMKKVNKMADELEPLKAEVVQIAQDTSNIKVILDVKQSEWAVVHERNHVMNHQPEVVVEKAISTSNRFILLDDVALQPEESQETEESTVHQPTDVHSYTSFPSPQPVQPNEQASEIQQIE